MWSILVTWALVGSFQDMWLIQNPVFVDQQSCIAYARTNRAKIYEDAMRDFGTFVIPDKIYCVDEAGVDFLNKKGYKVEQL